MGSNVGIIIQARVGSTRLPNKVLIEVSGKPLLWHVVERCKKSQVNRVIVATSTNTENDKIQEFCEKNDYFLFRGSENDVLSRYYEAARKFKLDSIIRVTGDCPLISPEIINQIIKKFNEEKVDYLSNVFQRSFPRGLDCEIFTFDALEKANNLAKEKPHREHVTAFIYGNPSLFKLGSLVAEEKLNRPNFRLCVDTTNDLNLIKEIYKNLYSGKEIPIEEVIDFLDEHPELANMNNEEEIKQREQNLNEGITQTVMNKSFGKEMKIENRKIGSNHPCFIIAELSGNHLQSYENAEKLVKAACEAGVDAIKLQTYTPDTITLNPEGVKQEIIDRNLTVRIDHPDWKGMTYYQLYQTAYTPWEWHSKLKKITDERKVVLFSSPFDDTAVDFLEKQEVPVYKISSFDSINIPLLKKVANTGKPVIMSTGMASVEELEEACKTLTDNGCPEIALLHCVSSYPAKYEELNLSKIVDLKKRFGVTVGFSDHSLTTDVPAMAVGLGARIIEKHICLDRKMGGPDAAFSLEPNEFKELVRRIREIEEKGIIITEEELNNFGISYGVARYGTNDNAKEARPALWINANVQKGEKLTKENVKVARPGKGLLPRYYEEVLGKMAIEKIDKGTPLSLELISD